MYTHAPFSFPWYLKWPWFMYVCSPPIKMLHFFLTLSLSQLSLANLHCALLWQPDEKNKYTTVFPLVKTINTSVSQLLFYSGILDIACSWLEDILFYRIIFVYHFGRKLDSNSLPFFYTMQLCAAGSVKKQQKKISTKTIRHLPRVVKMLVCVFVHALDAYKC